MYYIDPVCNKKLRKKEEYAIIKYDGMVYHFCCKSCKEAFEKNPEEYITIRQHQPVCSECVCAAII